jgi:glucosamine-6-phosphate deaminase
MNRPSQAFESDLTKLDVVADANTMSARAADLVAEAIQQKPDAVICLPTGSTPLGMFDALAERVDRGEIDFSQVELYCLDEYIGVDRHDPNSLTGWLWSAFVARVGIDPQRVHVLPTTAVNPAEAAVSFDRELVQRGGLDLAVLGLGPNGHIGYNEPGSPHDSRTRVVMLTPESVRQAATYWSGNLSVPGVAITLGVGTLLEAKRIVLIVSGKAKSTILRRTLEDQPSTEVPATWLRLAGQRLHVVADREAASDLRAASAGGNFSA